MRQYIKNIVLILFAFLYLNTTTVLLLVTVSSAGMRNVEIISNSSGSKPIPCHEKTWIQRKHIPLTIKVSGLSAVKTEVDLLPKPFIHVTSLIPETQKIYLFDPYPIIQNKAPPIS